jgi:hypothetical protein
LDRPGQSAPYHGAPAASATSTGGSERVRGDMSSTVAGTTSPTGARARTQATTNRRLQIRPPAESDGGIRQSARPVVNRGARFGETCVLRQPGFTIRRLKRMPPWPSRRGRNIVLRGVTTATTRCEPGSRALKDCRRSRIATLRAPRLRPSLPGECASAPSGATGRRDAGEMRGKRQRPGSRMTRHAHAGTPLVDVRGGYEASGGRQGIARPQGCSRRPCQAV